MLLEQKTTKAAQTQAALVSAARRLTGRGGVASVSVKSVCAEANIGRTSYYNYFPDTDALVDALAAETTGELRATFDLLHSDLPRGLMRLTRSIETCLRMAEETPDRALLLTALAGTRQGPDAVLRHEIAEEIAGALAAGDLEMSGEEAWTYGIFLTTSLLACMRATALGDMPRGSVKEVSNALLTGVGMSRQELQRRARN
jgi:AcrR family transcriptional regulator